MLLSGTGFIPLKTQRSKFSVRSLRRSFGWRTPPGGPGSSKRNRPVDRSSADDQGAKMQHLHLRFMDLWIFSLVSPNGGVPWSNFNTNISFWLGWFGSTNYFRKRQCFYLFLFHMSHSPGASNGGGSRRTKATRGAENWNPHSHGLKCLKHQIFPNKKRYIHGAIPIFFWNHPLLHYSDPDISW